MYDYLHLTQKGYDKAFEPVNELLMQLLSEFDGELVTTSQSIFSSSPTTNRRNKLERFSLTRLSNHDPML
jgi:hypothetical protein